MAYGLNCVVVFGRALNIDTLTTALVSVRHLKKRIGKASVWLGSVL